MPYPDNLLDRSDCRGGHVWIGLNGAQYNVNGTIRLDSDVVTLTAHNEAGRALVTWGKEELLSANQTRYETFLMFVTIVHTAMIRRSLAGGS